MNTLSSLKSLSPVTLEYVSPDRNPAVRAEFDAAGSPLPCRDIEVIIASDNLHAHGVPFAMFGDDGAIMGEATLERPLSARGYPAVIRWRKNKRQGKYDRTDKGRVRKALYDRKDHRKARKSLRKVRTPAEEQARRKMRREARSDQEFVTIDTEGVNIADERWTENAGQPDEATYTPQKIVVIAAGNEKRSETICHVPLDDQRLGKAVPHLSSEDMMDFLCDLPGKFKKSFFVWYGGGYDATHLLKDLPYELGWEIAHQMPFSNADLPEEQRDLPNVGRVVLWIMRDGDGKPRKGFCINYLKGKWFQVGRLRDPARPWKKKPQARRSGGFDYERPPIRIDDVVGFYQCSFLEAMEGMQSSISVTQEEQELIKWGKPRRETFSNEPMDMIIRYNQAELNITARMMDAYRKELNEIGVKPIKWHGPGVVVAEILKQKGIIANKKQGILGHYPEFLSAETITDAQDWAHHAFSGGRIDLIRPGIHQDPATKIYEHDICSAYPSVIKNLPSMRGGEYKFHPGRHDMTLAELKEFVQALNMLSMIEIDWNFDVGGRSLTNKEWKAVERAG